MIIDASLLMGFIQIICFGFFCLAHVAILIYNQTKNVSCFSESHTHDIPTLDMKYIIILKYNYRSQFLSSDVKTGFALVNCHLIEKFRTLVV